MSKDPDLVKIAEKVNRQPPAVFQRKTKKSWEFYVPCGCQVDEYTIIPPDHGILLSYDLEFCILDISIQKHLPTFRHRLKQAWFMLRYGLTHLDPVCLMLRKNNTVEGEALVKFLTEVMEHAIAKDK